MLNGITMLHKIIKRKVKIRKLIKMISTTYHNKSKLS